MSYVRSRIARMKRRPQGHKAFAPLRRSMGDDVPSYATLPDYCFPLDENYFQTPGNPGQNGVPDYGTALSICSAGPQSDCDAKATADAMRFASVSADLEANWMPNASGSDDYAPADLKKIVDRMIELAGQANTISSQGLASLGVSDGQKAAISKFFHVINDIQIQNVNYETAIGQAQKSGAKAVHAPGLKDFITTSLDSLGQAVYSGSYIACDQPWWSGPLATLGAIAGAVAAACKAVGTIALAVGEKAVVAVEGGLDMIAVIEKIAPFAAVGLAAWWLFLREKKRGEKVFAL